MKNSYQIKVYYFNLHGQDRWDQLGITGLDELIVKTKIYGEKQSMHDWGPVNESRDIVHGKVMTFRGTKQLSLT